MFGRLVMSNGDRIPRSEALEYAGELIVLLADDCERIDIAGSLRRKKPDVGDIELVCIPSVWLDLFCNEIRTAARIETALTAYGIVLLKNGEHFKQFLYGKVKVDLFITTPECWGVIFTIRTGSAEFSHKLVTPRNQGGLLPSNLRVKDGRIWNGSTFLDTPEEIDVFRACNMAWIEPKDRI